MAAPLRHRFWLLAALLGLTVVAYWPSLSVPFQFDDYARITSNWNLHAGNWLRGIGQLGGVRVLPATSLALNFWLSGDDTTSYHVVNLLVHLMATAVVFRFAWLLARTPRLVGSAIGDRPLFFAGCAAAFFACHPLQTQAVTYIVQRFASMAALFYLASISEYLAGRLAASEEDARGSATTGSWRPRLHFVAATVLAVAALLSKENAVTLPLAVVLVELAFFGTRSIGQLARGGLMALPFLAMPVLWKVFAWRSRRGVSTAGNSMREVLDAVFTQGVDGATAIGPIEYLMTQMEVLPRYLALVVCPLGLNVDHDVAVATSLDGSVMLGGALLLALLSAGLWLLRRAPAVGFGIVWFFLTVSVESSLIPIHDVMMEHRMYLAMPGLAVSFAALMCRFHARRPWVAVAAAGTVVAVLSILTFSRNQVWQSALSLWSDAASKSPNKARVHVNVGVAHHLRDELDLAIANYCRAIAIDGNIAVARDNIEVALQQQGRLDDVMARLRPQRVPLAGGPDGAVLLEYDPSAVVCAEAP